MNFHAGHGPAVLSVKLRGYLVYMIYDDNLIQLFHHCANYLK